MNEMDNKELNKDGKDTGEEKVEDFEIEEGKEESNFAKETKEWLKSLIIAVVIALFIKTFLFNTTYVLGNSMYPTLHEKDRLIANVVSLYIRGPQRGDIVLLDAPDVPKKKYIKRVIGLPGDVVEIKNGEVYLNGEVLVENYIEEDSYTETYDQTLWEVKDGELFVLGDNRDQWASKDSRYFGCIDRKSLKGIAKFRFFPFDSRVGRLK